MRAYAPWTTICNTLYCATTGPRHGHGYGHGGAEVGGVSSLAFGRLSMFIAAFGVKGTKQFPLPWELSNISGHHTHKHTLSNIHSDI